MTARDCVLASVNRTTPARTLCLRWDNFATSGILAAWARKQLNRVAARKSLESNRREYPDCICSCGLGFFFVEVLEKMILDLCNWRQDPSLLAGK